MRLFDVTLKIQAKLNAWKNSNLNIPAHEYLDISLSDYEELIKYPYSYIRRTYYIDHCMLCDKQRKLTLHHLIPKKVHKRNFFILNYTNKDLAQCIDICNTCHNGIHKLYSEEYLAKNLYTLKKLMSDDRIFKYVEWSSKQKISK